MSKPQASDKPLTPPTSPVTHVQSNVREHQNGQQDDHNYHRDQNGHRDEERSSQRDGQDKSRASRVMVLCFDGTGNKFGQENSNVVRLFRALKKSNRHKQIVYYQPGIGTYSKHTFITKTASIIMSKLDSAIALHLNEHVKEGYQFIVQNYQPGDKICLFGFSRGAHTARVIAGMVYKVGILPKENIQQVDFAFNVYNATGYEGYKLGQEFKRTFTPIEDATIVDFVGVWDTVSSVGIIPRAHPYTSVNYAVKTFRHALALDERRARFRPNVWNEMTLEREHELDIDIAVPNVPAECTTNRDELKFEPPKRKFADVKEVWFAGTHADVGGGSHKVTRPTSLSHIPFRWMVKEAILAGTGIQFDMEYLRETADFNFVRLYNDIQERGVDVGEELFKQLEVYSRDQLNEAATNQDGQSKNHQSDVNKPIRRWHRVEDIIDDIFDQLLIVLFWWILEIIPLLYTYQNPRGNWVRKRMRNLGRGRYIPVYKNKVLVHSTVKERIEKMNEKDDRQNQGDDEGKTGGGFLELLRERLTQRKRYKPRAFNWDHLQELEEVIDYVN